ncbi:hypothetical protein [Kaarinaea lacus]
MKNKEKENISFVERIMTAFLSVLFMGITCVVVTFILFVVSGKGAGGPSEIILSETWYWKLAFALCGFAGVLGFVLGTEKMSDIFGFIWRTNKPKDGNWL